jgi:hypothetical protein
MRRPLVSVCLSVYPQAHFREVAARSEAQLEKLGTKQLGRLVPEHATARAAVLLLLHAQGWPNHVLWERWQEMHPPGSLAMMVHLKVRGCPWQAAPSV